ncbi:MAG: prepilin-type N-terminal cleavage/methylation domain-containing protein [Desulfobacterales bacterium]|nr:prepilin-type N-terminal cleavage/methylation domain-containing protein [Desulfobacterales bacterium]
MKNDHAFTMVELLIVMAVMTIMMSLAIPEFRALRDRNQLKSVTCLIQNELSRAKLLAMKERFQYRLQFTPIGFEIQKGTSSTGPFVLDRVILSRNLNLDQNACWNQQSPWRVLFSLHRLFRIRMYAAMVAIQDYML